MTRYLLWTLLIGVLAFTNPQNTDYPQDYFRSPIASTIRLSGTFGELRPNHLHAGIDIKGKVGQSLFAIADGYVSRIKVQSGGYGNVLYVNHPNGYTSVYAHLDRFPGSIAEYVKQYQYKKQSFEVDIFPGPDRFTFKQGETIGWLGLSGRSFGPHLHFEIRNTRTEKPINPLLFGLKIQDDRAPKLHQLRTYFLNDKFETVQAKSYNLIRNGNKYTIKGDTLNLGAWRIGMAIKAYDHMNGVPNWNGVYAISLAVDDQIVYDFEMETFSFAESRYINAHLDYEEQVAKKSYFHRMYRLPGNALSIYQQKVNDGVVKLHQNKPSKITIRALDTDGNESSLEFWVRRGEVKVNDDKTYNYILPYNEKNKIDNGQLAITFPNGTFYENVYLQVNSSREKSANLYSPVYHIQDYKTPIHKYFDIAIAPDVIPEGVKDKAFIAYCGKSQKSISCGGTWKDGKLQAKARAFGDYSIMVDTEAPKITPIYYYRNMRGKSKMTFKITDNYDTARNVDYLTYEGYIDNQWILLEYDSKKDLLTYRFDDKIGQGEHQLKLIVKDHRDNEQVLERTFLR